MTIVSRLLATRVREAPDAGAYLSAADGRALTWREVAAHAANWAHVVPPGSRVGIVVADPLLFTAAYLGCLAAGLTATPIDPRLTAAELPGVLARLRVDVLATDSPEPLIRPDTATLLVEPAGPREIWAATTATRPSENVPLRPAVLLTSSGTTGRPKGIPLTEAQLMHAARRVAEHHGFGPGERGYTPLPLFHVNAQVMGLLATLSSGASLVVDRRFEAHEYWARVERFRPTWLNAVPAILASLAKHPAPPAWLAESIRFARSASAPLPPATAAAFTAHTGIGVLETYGMSEAAGQITANPVEAHLRRAGSVGLPVGVELIVAGVDERELPAGQEGEVLLRGEEIVAEYLELDENGPERVRPARTAGGWLRTGDIGVRDGDGFLTLAGRADDVINRGGEKLYPQEIENVLLEHPDVAAVAVVGAPHERLGQVPVAFVTTRSADAEALTGSLRTWCDERLTRYKRPAVIEVTDALPTGPTGKVLRRALRAELAGNR